MYEWTNGHRMMMATYKQKWIVEEYRWSGVSWDRMGHHKIVFNTLEEAKKYVTNELF